MDSIPIDDVLLAWCLGLAIVSLAVTIILDKNDLNKPRK
jgi:hypothetical protein